MPWNDNKGGDGWKSGGKGPWGDNGRGGKGQPDLEDFIKKHQDRFKRAMPGGSGGKGANFGMLGLALLVGAVIIGFKTVVLQVDLKEIGVITQFGKYDRQIEPGLHFKWPYPIEKAYILRPNEVKKTQIGPEDHVRRGRYRRERSQQSASPRETLMLTGDNRIAMVSFSVHWHIGDANKYLFNIEDPKNTVKDVAESATREVVGENSLEKVLSGNFEENRAKVRKLMQKVLDEYQTGIVIDKINFKRPDAPNEVLEAFLEVNTAQKQAEAEINKASAYSKSQRAIVEGVKTKIVNDAKAYSARMVKEAEGEAQRFNELYQAYKAAPDVTRKRLYLETMERVLSGTDKIILDGGKEGAGNVVPYLPLNELTKKTP